MLRTCKTDKKCPFNFNILLCILILFYNTIFIKYNFFPCFSTNNDEFADFSSAFTQSMSLNSSSTNLCKFFFYYTIYIKLKKNIYVVSANQKIISNSDLLTSLPQSSTNGTSRNLLDLNFDALDNTGNMFIIVNRCISYFN